MTRLFTSESVAIGHPDKVADQISDAVLDAYLLHDPHARVDCEAVVSSDLILLSGQISSSATAPYHEIIKKTMHEIGYSSTHFDIVIDINEQSPDIAQAVNKQNTLGAGDQGIMIGYASDDTAELMPLPIMLAHSLIEALRLQRVAGTMPFLLLDAKVQVTVRYSDDFQPEAIHTVIISAQHSDKIAYKELHEELLQLCKKILPSHLLNSHTRYLINPSGRFVIGGPTSDTGMTGRKQMVDTYGGMARHGGGAFSGKDPTKVDRSASYMARYIAKNVVASGLARRCEVELAYAIGMPLPVAVSINTFGTALLPEDLLLQAILKTFDLRVAGIIKTLDLLRPIYLKTAYGGHFGRQDPDFTWERTDKVGALKNA